MSVQRSYYYNDEVDQEIYDKIENISGGRIGTEKVEKLIYTLSEITKKHAFELADQYYSSTQANSLPIIYQQKPSINIILQQPSPTLPALPPIQRQILPQIIPVSPIPQISPITPYTNASYLPTNYLPQPPSFPISGLSTTGSPRNKRSNDHHKKSQKAKHEEKKHDHKSHRKSEVQKKSSKSEHRKKDEKKKGKHTKSKTIKKEEEEKDSTIIKIEQGSQEGGILRFFDQKASQKVDGDQIQIFVNTGANFTKTFSNLNSCLKRSDEYVHFERFKHDDWIIFDFKQNQVEITGYSIKSSTYRVNCTHLKNWSIDISDDGMNWETIDEHSNYEDLNGPSITKNFSVTRPSRFVRYARLMSKDDFYGKNSGWELEIGYVVFYGKIKSFKK